MYSGRLSVFWLSVCQHLLHVIWSLYLVDGFQRNVSQIFVVGLAIGEKIFKVKGQRKIIICELYRYNLYLYLAEGAISCVQMCECYNSMGVHVHINGVVSRLTSFLSRQ